MSPTQLPEVKEPGFWPEHDDLASISDRFEQISAKMTFDLLIEDPEKLFAYGSVLYVLGNMLPNSDERHPLHHLIEETS